VEEAEMGGRSWVGALAMGGLSLMAGTSPVGAQEAFTLVGGGGYLVVGGDATVASERDPGWALYGGIRRRINDRWSVQGGVQYGRVSVNPRSFFEAQDVFLSSPERHLDGGDLSILSVTVEGVWEHPFDRTTVGYLKAGAGFHSWSVDPLRLVDDEEFAGQIPDDVLSLSDDSSVGGQAGAGLRFPLGDNAGIWAEFVVHVMSADGGAMRVTPLRVGISFP
jgi:hypothetical protein